MSSEEPLRIVVAERPPLLNIDRSVDGDPIYSGLLWDLLPTMLGQAGINTTYTVYERNVSLPPGCHNLLLNKLNKTQQGRGLCAL